MFRSREFFTCIIMLVKRLKKTQLIKARNGTNTIPSLEKTIPMQISKKNDPSILLLEAILRASVLLKLAFTIINRIGLLRLFHIASFHLHAHYNTVCIRKTVLPKETNQANYCATKFQGNKLHNNHRCL